MLWFFVVSCAVRVVLIYTWEWGGKTRIPWLIHPHVIKPRDPCMISGRVFLKFFFGAWLHVYVVYGGFISINSDRISIRSDSSALSIPPAHLRWFLLAARTTTDQCRILGGLFGQTQWAVQCASGSADRYVCFSLGTAIRWTVDGSSIGHLYCVGIFILH